MIKIIMLSVLIGVICGIGCPRIGSACGLGKSLKSKHAIYVLIVVVSAVSTVALRMLSVA